MTGGKRYKIGDMCREFDLTPRTLRFYEDRGYVAPERRGTTRLYREIDREAIREIVKLTGFGFTLVETAQVRKMPEHARLKVYGDRLEELANERGRITKAMAAISDELSQFQGAL